MSVSCRDARGRGSSRWHGLRADSDWETTTQPVGPAGSGLALYPGSQLNTQDLLMDASLSNLAADQDHDQPADFTFGGGDDGFDPPPPVSMTPNAAPYSFFDSEKFKDPSSIVNTEFLRKHGLTLSGAKGSGSNLFGAKVDSGPDPLND